MELANTGSCLAYLAVSLAVNASATACLLSLFTSSCKIKTNVVLVFGGGGGGETVNFFFEGL
ncbi:hypothetical protein PF008_g25116 [Phytophthora fragariae]|uniref:Uncharacterized protein n=1 Tax=Phytophthora fragariae TaxID=53985 RepID=A0A6G0QKY0_9STRA|nr:hypothetical protein PF008_g25116 [Phytophthora fragariae]